MTRRSDPDETEGRAMYRAAADATANAQMARPRRASYGKRVCKCECGGQVRSVEGFGWLWTWCEKCTPVVGMPRTVGVSEDRKNG